MAPKGSPRDMNEWRATLRDPNIQFPGESSDYRRARNELLKAEDELRRLNAEVAAKRRALLEISCAGAAVRRAAQTS